MPLIYELGTFMGMFAILPLIAFCFLFLWLRLKNGLNGVLWDYRQDFLSASVILGAVTVGLTEVFSLFRAIAFWPFVCAWSVIAGIALILFVYQRFLLRRRQKDLPPPPASKTKKKAAPSIAKSGQSSSPHLFARFSWVDLILLVGIVILAALVGLTAFAAPPNTWDSMTYHMSRVMHWVQNHSVAHYPTHILRQLHLAPFAEFVILHLQVLAGRDQFANMVQWFSMVGCVLGVSLLAKQFGAGMGGQILSAVFCATIPMGILQGSSTQNDYILAFWLVSLANYLAILSKMEVPGPWLPVLFSGASLGLAALTKSTAFLYAASMILLLFGQRIFGQTRKTGSHIAKSIGYLAVIGLIALAINTGHFSRNLRMFGSPLGPMQEDPAGKYQYANENLGFKPLVSNVLRNAGLELATPLDEINKGIESGIRGIHQIFGINENDPGTTWTGTRFYVPSHPTSEDMAGSPLHVLLLLLAGVVAAVHRRNPLMWQMLLYGGALLLAFLLFSFYLRWQPWHNRLLLPLLVLAGSFAGTILGEVRHPKIIGITLSMVILTAFYPALRNQSRPLMGNQNAFNTPRYALRFINNPALLPPYVMAARFLEENGVARAGLITGTDAWEFPLWILMGQALHRPVHLEHIQVDNASRPMGAKEGEKADAHDFAAVLVLKTPDQPNLTPQGIGWERVFSEGPVDIYLPHGR